MYSIRLLSLAAILFGSLVANAAVAPHHVHPGSVFVAKPVHFDPPHPGHSGSSGHRNHPVIALSHPDAHGYVPVVTVSHNQPAHMGTIHDAQLYDHHTYHAGHGSFSQGSQIAVGHPTHVHVDDLNSINIESGMPHRLHPQDTHNLKEAVYHATGSGNHYDNDPHPAAPPPWRQPQNWQ